MIAFYGSTRAYSPVFEHHGFAGLSDELYERQKRGDVPGMLAAVTHLPVIGVPVKTSSLDGMDSLLSIVQMPRGVPVATVAINNATNAGLLAARIIGLADERVAAAVRAAQAGQRTMAHDADTRVSGEFSPPG